jgi:hypothetical protein
MVSLPMSRERNKNMSDMQKLIIEDAKASQRLSLECLAEAAEAPTIDLDPVDCRTITGLRRIRAASTHRLLSYSCNQGLLLYDNRSQLQHILTLEQLEDIIHSIKKE